MAMYGMQRMVDFAGWRYRREEARAERRGRSDQVFRAFIQVNVAPRAK
ncbi:MAG TPA: hypothetical protein VIO94_02945 [Phenylobacterium sp.]